MNILKLTASSVAGNVNTDFTADGDMEILYGHVVLTTDATVANRTVEIVVIDDAGTPATFADFHSGSVVTASSSNYHHDILPGIFRETSFLTTGASNIQLPVPRRFIIPSGYGLRVTVDNGVAGDSYNANFVAISLGKHSV